MTTHIRWWGGASTALLCLGFLMPGQSKAAKDDLILPKEVYLKLVDRAIQDIQDSLKELTTKILSRAQQRDLVQKARCAALMLAMYAQLGYVTIDERERTTLRNAALKLANTMDDEKFLEAKKQADTLKNLKPNPKAKLDAFPRKGIDIEYIMHQFRPVKEKGWDIESKLIKLSLASNKNKAVPAQELNEELVLIAYQTATAAELTTFYRPNRSPRTWLSLARDMGKSSKELAEAVQKKDGKGARTILAKLNTTCNQCHTLFEGYAIKPWDESQIKDLIATIKEQKYEPFVYTQAVRGLGKFGPAAKLAIPDLISLLKKKHPAYHQEVVIALGSIGLEAKTGLPNVDESLKDADDYLRYWFAHQLAQAGTDLPTALILLAAALRHPDELVSSKAAEVLGRIGKEAEPAIPGLLEALKDKDLDVRRSAVSALGYIGTSSTIPALIQAMHDPDPLVSIQASRALNRIGEPAVSALTEALKNKDNEVRTSAVFALARIDPKAKTAVPALMDLLKDQAESVRFAAGVALKKIDPEGAAKAGVR